MDSSEKIDLGAKRNLKIKEERITDILDPVSIHTDMELIMRNQHVNDHFQKSNCEEPFVVALEFSFGTCYDMVLDFFYNAQLMTRFMHLTSEIQKRYAKVEVIKLAIKLEIPLVEHTWKKGPKVNKRKNSPKTEEQKRISEFNFRIHCAKMIARKEQRVKDKDKEKQKTSEFYQSQKEYKFK